MAFGNWHPRNCTNTQTHKSTDTTLMRLTTPHGTHTETQYKQRNCGTLSNKDRLNDRGCHQRDRGEEKDAQRVIGQGEGGGEPCASAIERVVHGNRLDQKHRILFNSAVRKRGPIGLGAKKLRSARAAIRKCADELQHRRGGTIGNQRSRGRRETGYGNHAACNLRVNKL